MNEEPKCCFDCAEYHAYYSRDLEQERIVCDKTGQEIKDPDAEACAGFVKMEIIEE